MEDKTEGRRLYEEEERFNDLLDRLADAKSLDEIQSLDRKFNTAATRAEKGKSLKSRIRALFG